VLAAKTGFEAIQLAKTFNGNIDLAILDIVLPDLKAEHIYDQIKKYRPGLKVIICTGLSDSSRAKKRC
jgi:DNA-binding NtrC family response regulator